MSQVALQYGTQLAVADSTALNTLSAGELFPSASPPPGMSYPTWINSTVQELVDKGVIVESGSSSSISAAENYGAVQNATQFVSDVSKGIQPIGMTGSEMTLQSTIDLLTKAGIDPSDAQAIAQMGVTTSESGQVHPLNTGQQLVQQSQPLNTGSQAVTNLVNNIPKAPIQFVPQPAGQADWINWLILLVLAFIAIWIVTEVFR
ncbi:MAG: hypothetical protein JRN15_04870 [Nitrososphaerota archaeon]|nr:hypothetical protein [Nitrososphaerota archaeon]